MMTNQLPDRMIGSNCQYPLCKENSQLTISLPLLKQTESGWNASASGIKVVIPFCKYHFFIVGCDRFGIVEKKSPGQFVLQGPFLDVQLMEAVLAAREMTKLDQPKNLKEVRKHVDSKKKIS